MIKLVTVAGIVPSEVLSSMRDLADVDCPRCHGKGIGGYRNRVGEAVVCKCVAGILRAEAEEKLAKEEHANVSP